jgi:hypothetical protein
MLNPNPSARSGRASPSDLSEDGISPGPPRRLVRRKFAWQGGGPKRPASAMGRQEGGGQRELGSVDKKKFAVGKSLAEAQRNDAMKKEKEKGEREGGLGLANGDGVRGEWDAVHVSGGGAPVGGMLVGGDDDEYPAPKEVVDESTAFDE